MFTIMNSTSLWIGRDLKQFNKIRDALNAAKIDYKQKTKNESGQWTGRGTVRGNMGSIGNPTDQMYEYEILVYKKDLESAKHILRQLPLQ